MTADFRLLGPMEASVDGELVEPGHARQRCVLAVLLVEANHAVSADQLLDRVWGERPPHRARNVLSGYLSRLRQVLAPADEVRISRTPDGYVLVANPMAIDVHRFRRLVADARTADPPTAAELLTRAMGLWRGEPFATFDTPWLNEVREALKGERHAAELARNDLALQSGGHGAVLPDIAAAAELHPLDERLAGQLMLALYQSGRQDRALAAFQMIRRHLVEELGADPGPPLRRLHQQILDGDPTLTTRPSGRSTAGQASPHVPRQLPAPPPAFSGRDRELAELDAFLAPADQRPNSVVISGTGGVGKTALALQWARRAAHRFPDGQLYINLRGFDPSGSTVSPGEAVRGFLEALDVSPQRMPTSVDAQVGLYRSLLADRRILVVLDNARDVAQLRPLLPGAPGCLAVVTSRNHLTGLVATEGAAPLGLERSCAMSATGSTRWMSAIGAPTSGRSSPGRTPHWIPSPPGCSGSSGCIPDRTSHPAPRPGSSVDRSDRSPPP
jgi:DNA-binding SARP family transcriptional activator